MGRDGNRLRQAVEQEVAMECPTQPPDLNRVIIWEQMGAVQGMEDRLFATRETEPGGWATRSEPRGSDLSGTGKLFYMGNGADRRCFYAVR